MTKKTYNVFLSVRFSTQSESKRDAVKDAIEQLYKADHFGTVIGETTSVLNEKTNEWKEFKSQWYE